MVKNLKGLSLVVTALTLLSGCSSVMNTAGSGEYACPGMPMGVVCKTPSAVYKFTNMDIPDTEFDTPIGIKPAQNNTTDPVTTKTQRWAPSAKGMTSTSGPKPVREPAKVVRIWIAPWVDKQDNLHLAQIEYSEIKPRTWTIGKPEANGTSGYTVPHLAFNSIAGAGTPASQADAPKNERNEKRSSDVNALGASSQNPSREATLPPEPSN